MKTKMRQKTGTGKVVLMVTAVFLAAAVVPSMVGASPWSDAREKRGGMTGKEHHRPALGLWRNQQVMEQLGLTREQVQQLRDADFASREKRMDLKARLDQLRLQLDKVFSHEVSDEKAARQLAQKVAGVKGQMFVQQIEDRLALEAILTSDQIQKLKLNSMHPKRGGPGIGMQTSAKGYLAGRFDDGDCRRAK